MTMIMKRSFTVQYNQNYLPPQPYGQPQYPQPAYIPPQPTKEEYQSHIYKKGLRRTANGLGALLLAFFGLELLVASVAQLILTANGMAQELSEYNILFMLESGMTSSIVFFAAGLVYCLIRKLRFSSLFPFRKTGGTMLYRLCIIGLSFSLMSNYVVDILNRNLGLFGIKNTGGTIKTGDNPNVLLFFLTVAIIPAFVEEFAFRGVMMGVLRPYSEGLAIFVSSAAFALMHGNFVQLPFTFCCGLVFAYIDVKANSLLPSIIIHFLNNGLSVLFDILTAYKIASETTVQLIYGLIFVVTGTLAFFAIKHIVMNNDKRYYDLDPGSNVIPYKQKMKTVCTSPPIIAFTVIMLLFCLLTMLTGIS